MRSKTIQFVACMAIVSSLSCLGCAGGTDDSGPAINANVSGKVTSGGKPVSEATISFEKAGLGAWGTKLGADGSYSVELSVGEFKVAVMPIAPPVKMEPGALDNEPPKREDIPEAYRAASTSKATATIKDGDNTFDLDLK